MSQDDAAIQRAATLLSSSDPKENSNGAAMVINTAANAHSIPKLLRANIVGLLLPKLNTNDEDLLMKTCWAINNLCVHDEGRNACYSAGVLQYFGKVLQNNNSEVIKKASWALTNLARNPEAQREIIRGAVFTGLVNVLTYGKNDEEKGFALQPLCNLVLDANNQLAFKSANGLHATVKLLSSSVPKTQELAVTLVSFVTTNHDSVREELVELSVLPPLCTLLTGAKTGKLQEYALNCLVNLSLSEKAEKAILAQGAVRPVVGLLSCDDPRLQQQSAMLLSNLLTNEQIRASIRYFTWVDPVIRLIRTGDAATLQQVLRVVINVAFDEHCRYLLVKADAAGVINAATSQASDSNVYSLSSTAIKNLSVPVSAAVQAEVNQKLSSGGLESIHAPAAASRPADVDMGQLDSVLGEYGYSSSKKPSAPAPQHQHQHQHKPAAKATDDLDDLLNDFAPPPPVSKKPEPKPSYNPPKPAANKGYEVDDLDDLLNSVSKPPPPKPTPAKSYQQQHNLDDIDSLLMDINPPKKTSAKAGVNDDIDDLLNEIEAPPPKSKVNVDDIDDLLSDIAPAPASRKPNQTPARSSKPAATDDIDDLLNDFGGSYGGKGGSSYSKGGYGGGYSATSDIDDLLSDLNVGGPRQSNTSSRTPAGRNASSGLDVIDDLLADLNG